MCNGEFETSYCPVHWKEIDRMKRVAVMAEYIYLVIIAVLLWLLAFHWRPAMVFGVCVTLLGFAFIITSFCEGDNAWKSYFYHQEN